MYHRMYPQIVTSLTITEISPWWRCLAIDDNTMATGSIELMHDEDTTDKVCLSVCYDELFLIMIFPLTRVKERCIAMRSPAG